MASNLANPNPKIIVLCFDGTGDQFSTANTNVVKFYSCLDKTCPLEQTAYYQPGVGTYFSPGVVSPAFTWLAKIADEAIAWYLNDHVMAGYKFLMQNYHAGDKINIFGFSRGAYTARAVAGFIYKMGLLLPDNDELVTFAYDLYKREDSAGIALAAEFRRTFCNSVTIDFLGVWDTVASVGVIYGRGLPFTSDNRAVRIFRHALSLDEHRARFMPNLYRGEPPQDAPDSFPRVEEVWFAGCHADVGGSSVDNTVIPSLSDISLQWMVKQVILSRCGVKFDIDALRKVRIDESIIDLIASTSVAAVTPSNPQTPYWDPDALASIHDELRIKPLWWILEIIPVRYLWQYPNRSPKFSWRINFGRGRRILLHHPVFHRSVEKRIEDGHYKPKASWKANSQRYVD